MRIQICARLQYPLYLLRVLLPGLMAASLSACALPTVQPWEKGMLARPDMSMEGNDRLAAKFSEHIYTSREAAVKGAGVGGGGCGCN
jgi:hypothetical protein